MRVEVDKDICAGHAMCHLVAPDLFPLDADGAVASDVDEIPPGRERDARIGMTACPERAISIRTA